MQLKCDWRSRPPWGAIRMIILLLCLASCARPPAPVSTATPPPIAPTTAAIATPTPGPIPGAIEFIAPVDAGPALLDLAVLDPTNLDRLAPYKRLTADDVPHSIAQASLASYPSYEDQLAAHLDDGQLLVWGMSTGEVIYRDHHASDDSSAGQHPALAIDPSFQRYLATSAGSPEPGPAAASGIIYRRPDDPRASFLLSVAGGPPGTGEVVRVLSLAYSPDGHLLAASLSGAQGGFVQIWDVWEQGATTLVQQIDFEDRVMAVQFTPDGAALVCAAGEALVHLDPTTGAELARISLGFPIFGLALSASGDGLAAWGGEAGVVRSASLAVPLEIRPYAQIRRIEFSADERLAIAADGYALRFWDLTSGTELTAHLGPADILDVRILDNGRMIATLDAQARVLLWGVRIDPELPQTLARISPNNAGQLARGAGLYLPRSFDARLTARTDLLVVETPQGIYLAGLPGLQLRRLLPVGEGSPMVYDISADGAKLAWLADAGTIRVWNLEDDRLESELTGLGEDCCWQLKLAADGRYLATVADMAATVWDMRLREPIYVSQGVQQVHFSPDGTRVALEQGLEVSIIDLESRQRVGHLSGFSTAAPIITTKFSPDWSAMYWAGRASMQFVDVQSGRLGPAADFSWGEFSPDGKRIAVVEEGWIYATVGQAYLLDVRSGETLAILDHHQDAIIQAAAYSPDGRLIATALDRTIKIWDGATGAELTTLPAAGGRVHDLAFSPDGRLLLSRAEGELIELWAVPGEAASEAEAISVATAGSLAPVDRLQLGEAATDAVFSPDQTNIAISSGSGAIWTWDLAGGGASEAEPARQDWIYHLAYAPDGSGLASVSMGGYVRLKSGGNAYAVGIDSGEMSALAFLPLGERLASSGQDRTLRIWSTPSFRLLKSVEAHAAWIWGLAASPAGDLLATASADRTVKIWQISGLPTGDPGISLTHTLIGHSETVWGVAFSPDGRTLASASWDRTVRLWDAVGGGQLRTLRGHEDWVYDVAFSPAGDLVASASADGTVRLWEVATGVALATLEGSGDRIWSVDFSPDGRYLVSASGAGEVVLWGVAP